MPLLVCALTQIRDPRLWPAKSTSTEIVSKRVLQAGVLCIQVERLWQRHGAYLQSALEKPDACC